MHAARAAKRDAPAAIAAPAWKAAQTLVLVDGATFLGDSGSRGEAVNGEAGFAVVCATLDEVRDLSARALDVSGSVRAVPAPYIPGALVTLFSAAGVAAIRVDPAGAKALKGQRTIALPAPSSWPERGAAAVAVGGAKLSLTWLALGAERMWATGGHSASPSRSGHASHQR